MEAGSHAEGSAAAPTVPALPAPLPVRALQVFYAPGELFRRLSMRPLWLGALLLGGVLVAASFVLIPAELWEQTFREQMLRSGQQMPEGFDMGGAARWFGLVGGLFSWFLLTFVTTGVVTVVFHFFLGDEGRFKQYLAVVAHATLIAAIGGLLVLPLKVAQGDPTLTLNLGLFVPGNPESYPMRVLRTLDLFLLWSYVVMALGISKVEPRRSWGSATVFLVLFAVGIAMLIAAFVPAM